MNPLAHLPALPAGPLMYAALAVLVVASAIPVVAVVVAAEPFIFAAVLTTGGSPTSVETLLLVALVASVAGDVLSYWVGRRFGIGLLHARGVRRWRHNVTGASQSVRRRGMLTAVIMQRWVPPGRGFVPAIIGATEEPFGRFVGAATVAAALWSAALVLGAHFGGTRLMLSVFVVITMVIIVGGARRLARRIRAGRGADAGHQQAMQKSV